MTVPSRQVEHIGFHLDLVHHNVKLSSKRLSQVLHMIRLLSQCHLTISLLEWQRVAGFLGWARCGSPLVLGLLSPIIDIINACDPKSPSKHAKNDWSALHAHFAPNKPIPFVFRTSKAQVLITDATPVLGGVLHEHGVDVLPIPDHLQGTPYRAELYTMVQGLLRHAKKDAVIYLWGDNQAAMSSIIKGRSRDPVVQPLINSLWSHLSRLKSLCVSAYVRSQYNPADQVSRLGFVPSRRLVPRCSTT